MQRLTSKRFRFALGQHGAENLAGPGGDGIALSFGTLADLSSMHLGLQGTNGLESFLTMA